MATIAQAFNAITVAQGGTPKGGTIVDAIDALTDTLAGSDQPKPQTIAEAVTLLGEHIGGGGGGGEISETNYCFVTDPSGFQYISAPGTEIAIISDSYTFKINDTAQVPTRELELDGDPYAVYTIPSTATAEDDIVIESID